MPRPSDPAGLVDALRDGDVRALARAISIVEDGRPGAAEILSSCYRMGGRARIVGITGAPGSGKSTLTDRLIGVIRGQGGTVAVVAVDPSSPFSGGSILGDRIRMQRHVSDRSVFVRSMSSRGHLGGLADATAKVLALVDAAGFETILVETVGVGQSEVEVAGSADTTVVVVTPGWGDAVQAAKAGLLEVGDVFVVNKADRPGADEVARELIEMLELGPANRPWVPPIVTASALEGTGIGEVWEAIAAHTRFLEDGDRLAAVRRERAAAELRRAAMARVSAHVGGIDPALLDAVTERRLDPWAAAESVRGPSQP